MRYACTDASPLTAGEIDLARSVFGDAIDYAQVRLVEGKWWPFQPRRRAMAPMGNIYFHPDGGGWSDDFSKEPLGRQGFFIHEMTHVWQAQKGGRFYLPLMRHPFCRYRYELEPASRSSATASSSRPRSSRTRFLQIGVGTCHRPVAPAWTCCHSGGWMTEHVAVIGAGVFGAWTAHHLLRAGHRVTLIDAYGPAHSRASSGGESRLTRAAYGKDAIYTRMAIDRLAEWKALSADAGPADLHPDCGVLFFFPTDEPYVRDTIAAHRSLGLPTEVLTPSGNGPALSDDRLRRDPASASSSPIRRVDGAPRGADVGRPFRRALAATT